MFERNEAESRCELCGGIVTSAGECDTRPAHTAAEALRFLADIWLQDRRAAEIILCRLVIPGASYRDIAKMCKSRVQYIDYSMKNIGKAFPQVEGFCRDHGPRASGQRRRWIMTNRANGREETTNGTIDESGNGGKVRVVRNRTR